MRVWRGIVAENKRAINARVSAARSRADICALAASGVCIEAWRHLRLNRRQAESRLRNILYCLSGIRRRGGIGEYRIANSRSVHSYLIFVGGNGGEKAKIIKVSESGDMSLIDRRKKTANVASIERRSVALMAK